jgi:hypothetical protein
VSYITGIKKERRYHLYQYRGLLRVTGEPNAAVTNAPGQSLRLRIRDG